MNKKQSEKKQRTSLDLSTLVYGKIPPQAKDLEVAILGAIMLERGAIDIVAELLKPEAFYVDAHQRIYSCMLSLNAKSQPLDILLVVQELERTGQLENVGGALFVTKLTNAVVSAANIEAHSRIVLQKYIQREFIRIGGEMITDAYENTTDIFDMMDDAEGKIVGITNMIHKQNFQKADTLLVQTITRIEDLRKHDGTLTGVPTGFRSIDRITHGWQAEDLIILAARPSVGKTAFAINLARNAALDRFKPTPTAYFSLEMSAQQIIQRVLSAESKISLERIMRGKLEEPDMKVLYQQGIQPLANMDLYIDDQAALNIFELRAKVRRLKSKYNIGLVIIDYLQLMSGTGDRNMNREQEIAQISRGLKALAKEMKIPIIALSQLSRAVETRGGEKMPQLSDLRESGALEQDADAVLFLYRPDYYGKVKDEAGDSLVGETHVRVAKNRNGSLDLVKLRAELWIQKFYDMDNQLTLPSDTQMGRSAGEGQLTGDRMWKAIPGTDFDFKSKAAGTDKD